MKDPAFLFYPSDFLSGTMLMSDEQVGKYIRLLCLQHQKGHLSEKDMLKICISYDQDIFEKFVIDDNGKYYNVRLNDEIIRRIAYSESRSKNRKASNSRTKEVKKDMNNICLSHDEHMGTETITITNTKEKGSRGKQFTKPTLDEVAAYCMERNNTVNPQAWLDHYESNGWKVGQNSMKDWKAAVRTWEKRQFGTTTSKSPIGNFKGREYTQNEFEQMYEKVEVDDDSDDKV